MIILYNYLHYAVKAFVNRIGVKESYEDAEGTSCLFCDRQVAFDQARFLGSKSGLWIYKDGGF